jgi:CO/xanthine dehydrogenase Mo-binding subunit
MSGIVAERYTGASIKRSEDPRILTGAGRYVDDIKLPGMLHAAFVRSPMAHARVLAVEAAAPRGRPGGSAVRPAGRQRARAGIHPARDGQGAFRRRSGRGRHR